MKQDCVGFLQWALPQMKLRWDGFRKVRKQVCKRIRRRMKLLNLPDYEAYQNWLQVHDSEWEVLDSMCRITISRFYRDWEVFDYLKEELLLQLALQAQAKERSLRCWSAGCASGEEPYTLSLIWNFLFKERFSELDFNIIATDVDSKMLNRAETGCYRLGTLKGLPKSWLNQAFYVSGDQYCIHSHLGDCITWVQQDIRESLPSGKFDLVLCRNLVATYFGPELQIITFNRMKTVLEPGGILILGCHEKLPKETDGFTIVKEKLRIYQKDQ